MFYSGVDKNSVRGDIQQKFTQRGDFWKFLKILYKIKSHKQIKKFPKNFQE